MPARSVGIPGPSVVWHLRHVAAWSATGAAQHRPGIQGPWCEDRFYLEPRLTLESLI